MIRKVVKHGPATFVISLPSKWVKQYGINKGDELEVQENGSEITVSTHQTKNQGNVEVDATNLDRSSLTYLIRVLYKLGYEEISLQFKDQTTIYHRLGTKRTVISVIHEELNRLSGMEVIQQKENLCVIKALSELTYSQFDPMLRRIFFMIVDMSEDLVKAAEKQDTSLLETLEEKHNTITKFLSFCMRILLKRGYGNSKHTAILFSLLMMIDKVLDTLKNTSRQLLKWGSKCSKNTINLMMIIHQSIAYFCQMYYKFDNSKVMFISELRDKVPKDIWKNIDEISKGELIIVTSIAQIMELVFAMTELRITMEY